MGLFTMVLVMDGMSMSTMTIAMTKTSHEQNAPIKLMIVVVGPTNFRNEPEDESRKEQIKSNDALTMGPNTQNKLKVDMSKLSQPPAAPVTDMSDCSE